MTSLEGVSERLELASAQALKERDRLWTSLASNEEAKARLTTFDRRFAQAAADLPPTGPQDPSEHPDRALVSTLNQVTEGARQIDQLSKQMEYAQAEIDALAARGRQFWMVLAAVLVIAILAAVFLLR